MACEESRRLDTPSGYRGESLFAIQDVLLRVVELGGYSRNVDSWAGSASLHPLMTEQDEHR